MRSSAHILGISPGTRTLGLAVFTDRELIDAKVKKVYGKWSQKKLRFILDLIAKEIINHAITTIVFKLPDTDRSSKALNILVTKIRELIKERQLHAYAFTLSNIKQMLLQGQTSTIETIITFVVERYPELTEEYRKEQKNRNSHYKKMFEAVALGICLQRQNLPPPFAKE